MRSFAWQFPRNTASSLEATGDHACGPSGDFLRHGSGVQKACRSLAGFRLARSLDNEPLLVSKLVEIASWEQALAGLQEALNQRSFTDAELLRLQTALRDAESAVSFGPAMLGERVNLVAAFQSSDEKLADAMAMRGGGAAAAPPQMLRNYRSGGHLQEDFAFALEFMSKLVALADLPFPQSLVAAAEMKMLDAQKVVDEKLVVSAALLPEPARLVNKGAEAVARIRLMQMVLTVERYRLKHDGALPNSLADLSGEWSGRMSEDPFVGQPLRYRKLPAGGYTVYSVSVGADGKDDGGAVESPDGDTPRDVVVTITR